MPIYTVFHKYGVSDGSQLCRWATPVADVYVKVAVVDAESLDRVFELTNHITDDWTANPLIDIALPESRSTSVGDIIRLPSGALFRVDSVGFSRVSQEV
jgi:hypothetical protein